MTKEFKDAVTAIGSDGQAFLRGRVSAAESKFFVAYNRVLMEVKGCIPLDWEDSLASQSTLVHAVVARPDNRRRNRF